MGFFNNRKKKDTQSAVTPTAYLQSAPNTPPSVYEQAEGKFAEIYGSSMVSAQRSFLISFGCVLLAIGSVGTVLTILPLKEIQSWVVEVNPTSGVVNKPVQIARVEPNLAVIKSELARWVEAVYMIDPLRTQEALRWANARAADKAVQQFAEFRAREKTYERMRTEPEMVREAKVTAVDVSHKGTAFIYVTTTERVGAAAASPEKVKRVRVSLNYALVPPTTEDALLANPLGLFVTFFSEVEERAQ